LNLSRSSRGTNALSYYLNNIEIKMDTASLVVRLIKY